MNLAFYNSRIDSAEQIIEVLKENLMEIFWEEDPFEFCSSRALLPFIQEDAEYSIKKLHLKEQDQIFYLQKIEQVFGEYCEI